MRRFATCGRFLWCAAPSRRDGDALVVVCENGSHNVADVLGVLRHHRLTPGRIWAEPPTLNDVFLEITGRELRD